MIRRYLFQGVMALSVSSWVVAAPALEPAPAQAAPARAQEPAQAAPPGPGPHIVFDSVTINVGEVVHGQDALATFAYRNTGDAPLHIISAKPG